MLQRPTLAAVCLLMSAASALAQSGADTPIEIAIDPTKPGAKIDRHLFGQFAEHLGTGIYGGVWVGPDSPIPHVRGIRKDVVSALKAIRVPNVRWPGGCFADEYHWRHGIGPASSRRVSINSNWGGAIEPGTFGTHEFMDFVEQIGSDAYISINVGSGTVQEAAEWIEYMTADPATTAGKERAANGRLAPWKVKFLGIGNESWACGGAMSARYYTDLMKPYARFVRNYHAKQTGADAMQRIAVGPGDEKTDYTEAVMQTQAAHDWSWNIEGLSLHRYTVGGWPPSKPSVGFDETGYATLIRETLGMDAFIARNAAIMDKHDPDKKVMIAVDEWGVWLAPSPGSNPGFLQQQNSIRDAIIAALNLNIFARRADRVKVANIAQMVNVLQAMILTDQEKMVLTPTYHVFKMYLPFQDAMFIPVEFDAGTYVHDGVSLPRVDAVAARDTAGQLWLTVTNLDPDRPARIIANLPGISVRSASGEILSGPRVDSHNTFDAPNTVVPKAFSGKARGNRVTLDLPGKSVVMVRIET